MAKGTEQIAAGTDARFCRPRQRRLGTLPLSFHQEWFWNSVQAEPFHQVINHSLALRLRGKLNAPVLQNALDAILARHELLRARFFVEDGNPWQWIGPAESVEVLHQDFSADPERTGKLEILFSAESARPFDLECDAPFRAVLTHLDRQEHFLLLTTHQLAIEEKAWRVIVRDFCGFYGAFSSGQPVAPFWLSREEKTTDNERLLTGTLFAWQDFLKECPALPGLKVEAAELPARWEMPPAAPRLHTPAYAA